MVILITLEELPLLLLLFDSMAFGMVSGLVNGRATGLGLGELGSVCLLGVEGIMLVLFVFSAF